MIMFQYQVFQLWYHSFQVLVSVFLLFIYIFIVFGGKSFVDTDRVDKGSQGINHKQVYIKHQRKI